MCRNVAYHSERIQLSARSIREINRRIESPMGYDQHCFVGQCVVKYCSLAAAVSADMFAFVWVVFPRGHDGSCPFGVTCPRSVGCTLRVPAL